MPTVTLELPDTLGKKLQARATEQGRDVATLAIEILAKELAKPPPTNGNQVLTGDGWLREFDAWMKSHPKIDVVLDDSRESMYEGRGE